MEHGHALPPPSPAASAPGTSHDKLATRSKTLYRELFTLLPEGLQIGHRRRTVPGQQCRILRALDTPARWLRAVQFTRPARRRNSVNKPPCEGGSQPNSSRYTVVVSCRARRSATRSCECGGSSSRRDHPVPPSDAQTAHDLALQVPGSCTGGRVRRTAPSRRARRRSHRSR